jgi:hypothetical protein
MKFKVDIEPRLEILKGLLIEAIALYDDVVYCHDIIDKDGNFTLSNLTVLEAFVSRYYGMSWSLLVIKLYPIYHKNDDCSILKIINILKNNFKGSDWKERIKLEDITLLEERLNQTEIIEAVRSLDEIRTKHVGHIDLKRSLEAQIKYEHANILISNAIDFTNIIYQMIAGYSQDYFIPPYMKVKFVLDQLRKP